MPNHFHFLIRIKSENIILERLKKGAAIIQAHHTQTSFETSKNQAIQDLTGVQTSKNQALKGFQTLSGLEKQKAISTYLSLQFSHVFNSYTQALNKQISRKGTLFMRPFKRKLVTDQKYLLKLVHYIHHNPIETGLCDKPQNWPHSSFTYLISSNQDQPFLSKEETINWFNDKENFIYIHSEIPELSGIHY